MPEINVFDRVMKIIAREHAETFLQIAFPDENITLVGTLENVELTLPEERVDFVHQLSYHDEEYLLHLEFQLRHKSDFPKRMFIYSAELTDLFDLPVISLVLYLERRQAPLPDSYTVCLGDKIINRFSYQILKLWEYEQEIKAGKFPALVPLLSMLVEEATEETLIVERELILQEENARKRAHLLATAVTIASRYFDRNFLWQFFSEEVEQMRSVPIIQDWIEEGIQQGIQRGVQQGRQEGWRDGRQEGYIQARKEDIISILEKRFGIVKAALLDELEKVKRAESLKMLLNRTIEAQTQEEFLSLIKLAAGE